MYDPTCGSGSLLLRVAHESHPHGHEAGRVGDQRVPPAFTGAGTSRQRSIGIAQHGDLSADQRALRGGIGDLPTDGDGALRPRTAGKAEQRKRNEESRSAKRSGHRVSSNISRA